MKILYHHRTLAKDGQNVHIEELIKAFQRAGHEIRIVGPAAHRAAAFGSDNGVSNWIRSKLPGAVGEVLELGYSLLAFYRLFGAYRSFRPDVIYERYNLFLLSGAWLHALTGVPLFLEVNAPLAEERRLNSGLSLRRLAEWSERFVWRAASRVLPVTEVLAKHVTRAGVSLKQVAVIPNGIDPQHFAPTVSGARIRDLYGLGGKLVIGFTGFLREWHGLPAIVDVVKELAGQGYPLHFLVVGDGPGRPALEQAAARAGIEERITITGVTDRQAIPEHVAAFDIAVQPKATACASPLKLFEYMALGRAILAPDQPNLREVLTHGQNALLFSPDDTTALTRELARLIVDYNLRERVGLAAQMTVRERDLTWDGNARKIAAEIERESAARADSSASRLIDNQTMPVGS